MFVSAVAVVPLQQRNVSVSGKECEGRGTDLECAIPAVAGALVGVDGPFRRGEGEGVELERGDDDEGCDERRGGRDEEGCH